MLCLGEEEEEKEYSFFVTILLDIDTNKKMWEKELRPYYVELLRNEYNLNWQSKMNIDTYWTIMDQCFSFSQDDHLHDCVLKYYITRIRNKYDIDAIDFGTLITFHMMVEKAMTEYNRQLRMYQQQMKSLFQIDVLMDDDDDDDTDVK